MGTPAFSQGIPFPQNDLSIEFDFPDLFQVGVHNIELKYC